MSNDILDLRERVSTALRDLIEEQECTVFDAFHAAVLELVDEYGNVADAAEAMREHAALIEKVYSGARVQ